MKLSFTPGIRNTRCQCSGVARPSGENLGSLPGRGLQDESGNISRGHTAEKGVQANGARGKREPNLFRDSVSEAMVGAQTAVSRRKQRGGLCILEVGMWLVEDLLRF